MRSQIDLETPDSNLTYSNTLSIPKKNPGRKVKSRKKTEGTKYDSEESSVS